MKNPGGAQTDEQRARRLLEAYLSDAGYSGFQCMENTCDPPDLFIAWDDGTYCGVEVTRTYALVLNVGSDATQDPISSQGVELYLRRFGEALGKETISIRKRNYSLALRGPDPLSNWRSYITKRDWENETRQRVSEHIRNGESEWLEGRGFTLKPGEPGSRWTVFPLRIAEIEPSVESMMRRCIQKKQADIARWATPCSQRWLIVLNFAELEDDHAQVARIVQDILQASASSATFDRVLWRPIGGDRLVDVSCPSAGGGGAAQ